MDHFLRLLLDQTINGLVIGNIYALIAVGLALVFGVGNLINFAHGSVYMIGGYVGWLCVVRWQLPLPVAFLAVMVICAAISILIERLGVRPLQNSARIAPLLSTIGISFVLDQAVTILFSPDPKSFHNPLPNWSIQIVDVRISALDIMIAVLGIASAGGLYILLRFTKLGWALRATAQDRDAAQQMGIDVDRVNSSAFAIAGMLGGVGGMLVGMYFQTVYPTMSFQAGLKGFSANLLGGLGNVPGAMIGGLALGLIESYGVALFGATYRNMFAFIILIAVLVLRPAGLLSPRRELPPEPLTGTFIANKRSIRIPRSLLIGLVVLSLGLPLVIHDPYILQVLSTAWLLALVTLSVTLVTGTAGQTALGQAGFLAIGAYTSALLTLRLGWSFELSLFAAVIVTALFGTLLVLPAFRLRSHYVAIATLGIGEIVSQVILNWRPVTNGAIGLSAIAPPSLFSHEIVQPNEVYWYTLVILLVVCLFQFTLTRSALGRVWRALRDDEIAAQSYGINLYRYKAMAFALSAGIAGLSGAFTAHLYTYINYQTFTNTTSILALTMAILGGLGNVFGAVVGSVALTVLPELLRGLVDYRYLVYGLVLVLLVRFRPQGLIGTD